MRLEHHSLIRHLQIQLPISTQQHRIILSWLQVLQLRADTHIHASKTTATHHHQKLMHVA